MKKAQIVVGGLYTAKVRGVLTTVRVDEIVRTSFFDQPSFPRLRTAYNVTNLKTGRTTTFRSATKFRGPAAINDPFRKAARTPRTTTPEVPAVKSADYNDTIPGAPTKADFIHPLNRHNM